MMTNMEANAHQITQLDVPGMCSVLTVFILLMAKEFSPNLAKCSSILIEPSL
jgi:hypothetical protein